MDHSSEDKCMVCTPPPHIPSTQGGSGCSWCPQHQAYRGTAHSLSGTTGPSAQSGLTMTPLSHTCNLDKWTRWRQFMYNPLCSNNINQIYQPHLLFIIHVPIMLMQFFTRRGHFSLRTEQETDVYQTRYPNPLSSRVHA